MSATTSTTQDTQGLIQSIVCNLSDRTFHFPRLKMNEMQGSSQILGRNT
jgi:hypothetical protein